MVQKLEDVAGEVDGAIPELEEAAGGFQWATAEFRVEEPVPGFERSGIEPGYVALGLEQMALGQGLELELQIDETFLESENEVVSSGFHRPVPDCD